MRKLSGLLQRSAESVHPVQRCCYVKRQSGKAANSSGLERLRGTNIFRLGTGFYQASRGACQNPRSYTDADQFQEASLILTTPGHGPQSNLQDRGG
jgi:hypothetical protein